MVKPKSEMEWHQAMMRELMRSRERRETKRNIGRLSVAEVRAELTFNGCSCTGPEATLRERLLRAVLRIEEPGNAESPWYSWDDAENAAPQDAAPVVTPRERVEREQATARDSSVRGGTGRATTASSSGEDEPQRANTVHSVSRAIECVNSRAADVYNNRQCADGSEHRDDDGDDGYTIVWHEANSRSIARAFRNAAHAEHGSLAGSTRTP